MSPKFMIIFLSFVYLKAINGYLFGGTCAKNISRTRGEKILHNYPEKLEGVFKNCALTCVRNQDCEQFSRLKGSCQLYTRLGHALHTVFDDKCKTHSDCSYQHGHCLSDLCSCSIGYSYDFENNACVKACTSYGARFSVYKDTGIKYLNTKVLLLPSLESCTDKCRSETSFVCINAEFSNGTCHLCDKSWAEIPREQKNDGTDKGWDLLYRHCSELQLD